MENYLITGMGAFGAATTIAVLRFATGSFFAISGYHKLFNRERHASLVGTLQGDGLKGVAFLQWFVPLIEFSAGLGVAFGFLTPLSSLGLIAICFVATCVDGSKRITSWLDRADWVDDYLYLPEVIYTIVLLSFVGSGGGPYSLDALILHYLAS